MKLEELFDHITKIIASPHITILEEDKKRAVRVLMVIEQYMIDNYMNEHGEYEQGYDCDFGQYAQSFLDHEG